MMIDAREPEVLEGKAGQAAQCVVGGQLAAGHRVQKLPKLTFVQSPRIVQSPMALAPVGWVALDPLGPRAAAFPVCSRS